MNRARVATREEVGVSSQGKSNINNTRHLYRIYRSLFLGYEPFASMCNTFRDTDFHGI